MLTYLKNHKLYIVSQKLVLINKLVTRLFKSVNPFLNPKTHWSPKEGFAKSETFLKNTERTEIESKSQPIPRKPNKVPLQRCQKSFCIS